MSFQTRSKTFFFKNANIFFINFSQQNFTIFLFRQKSFYIFCKIEYISGKRTNDPLAPKKISVEKSTISIYIK